MQIVNIVLFASPAKYSLRCVHDVLQYILGVQGSLRM